MLTAFIIISFGKKPLTCIVIIYADYGLNTPVIAFNSHTMM